MRFGERRRVTERACDSDDGGRDARSGDSEKFANGVPLADVMTPVIVAPLFAVNATEAPATCALVTVTTCVPALGDNVHVTRDLPAVSVVVAVDDSVPPPLAVQVSGMFATGRLAASSTCTTSAESRAAERSAD